MRVTEKGQVTIPKDIRDRLGIVPGSEVEFIASDDGVRLIMAGWSAADRVRRFEEWARKIEGTLDLGGVSTDEYMEELRGPRDDVDRR